MKTTLLAVTMLCAVGFADVARAGGREPGSLLLFPVQHSGGGLFTVVSVTNAETTPATSQQIGGSTRVHFYYTNVTPNPVDPFRPLACSVFDRVESLTPADTMSVLTECHNLNGATGHHGYLVVVAEDPTQFATPWSHNHLLGSALVLSATGFAYRLEALTFRSPAPAGAATDVDGDLQLDFDGIEYELLPDRLYLDSFLAEQEPQLALVSLTGTSNDLHTVLFSVWNDYEVPLSATLTFQCWFEAPLTRISPLFAASFLYGMPNDTSDLDTDCDGVHDLETGWVLLQSLGVRTAGGVFVAADGALMGAMTAGTTSICDPRRHLGESATKQANGALQH